MSSFLSIHNDTSDTWYIKLSHDEKALKGAGILLTALGTASSLGALVGECTTGHKKIGNKSAAAAAVLAGSGAVVAGSAAIASSGKSMEWTKNILHDVDQELANGVDRLTPGDTKKYGKMSLSLWKQCTAVRHRLNPEDPDEVLVESILMRPIFSGATNGSDKVHNIKEWLDKEGAKVLHRIRRPDTWK